MKQLPRLIPFPGAPVREGASEGAEGAEVTETAAIAERVEARAATGQRAAREESLNQALAAVRRRWGYGSIVRLDRASALADPAQHARRPKSTRELPPWWPRSVGPDGAAGVLRPRLLEVVAEPGSGRLTLALTWLAAAHPMLAAIVDFPTSPIWRSAPLSTPQSNIQHPNLALERFYPPAAAGAGLSLDRLIVVQPPAGADRAALDAVVVLLRSEAFDAILCPLPARTRISTSFAGKLATLAARATTSLLLLTQPSPSSTSDFGLGFPAPPLVRGAGRTSDYSSALADFADYRVRLTTRRWLWEDGELVGLKLRAVTERARAPSSAAARAAAMAEDAAGGAVAHDLTFRLSRRVRHGVSAADRLSLTTSTRVPNGAEQEAPADGVGWPLAAAGSRSG